MTATGYLPSVALSPTALPRAGALTDALLAPPDSLEPPVNELFARTLGDRLTRALAESRSPRPGNRRTVNGWSLRAAMGVAAVDGTPFRWSPRTARRAIAVAAVRACATGECRTPPEAVRRITDEWLQRGEQGGAGRSAEAWLANLPAGGRAVVQAEAVTWATALFTALDWDRLGAVEIGGPDRWWDASSDGGVALRGRAEVRAVAHGHPVLLCVGNGRPRPSSRVELLLPALVEVLRRPHGPAPARVVGWWPASGRALVVTVGPQALTETVRVVMSAATRSTEIAA